MNFYTESFQPFSFIAKSKVSISQIQPITRQGNITFEKTSFLNLHIHSKIRTFVPLAGS